MAKSDKTPTVRAMWYIKNNFLRRLMLILFCVFVALPVYAVVGMIGFVFSLYYIPAMTLMYGIKGYSEALGNLYEALIVPLDFQISLMEIWNSPWE